MPFHARPFRRRNLVLNTVMTGVVPGDPAMIPGDDGAPPRDFLVAAGPPMEENNVDFCTVGAFSEAGLSRFDVALTSAGVFGDGNTAICCSDFGNAAIRNVRSGETYTFSLYARIIAQPGPLPTFTLQINEYDAAGGFLDDTRVTITPTSAPLRQQRWTVTRRIVSATANRIRPVLGIFYVAGQAFDFRIGLAGPQLEQGVRATPLQHRFI